MELYNRRLLLLNEDEPSSSSSDTSSPPRLTASPLSSSLFVTPLKLSASVPFNSDVAYIVIIVLLLIAFLVLFIRRFADHSPAHHSPPASSNSHSRSSSCGGLDQTTVQSLPVFRYKAEAKQPEDCAICLSEFEIDETVKMVPNCKHVFHLECIDTWLSSHVTCPICRGSKFLAVERRAESAKVVQPTSDDEIDSPQPLASTVENDATWREGRTMETSCHQRRSRSCSSSRDTVVLRRTLSN